MDIGPQPNLHPVPAGAMQAKGPSTHQSRFGKDNAASMFAQKLASHTGAHAAGKSVSPSGAHTAHTGRHIASTNSPVAPTAPHAASTPARPAPAAARVDLHSGLHQGRQAKPSSVPGEDRHNQLKTQAQKLIAQTFYGTVLKQMHKSPFKSKIFDGGRGGEAFGSLFDQKLADHMSRGAGGKLTNSLVKHIEGRAAYQASVAAEKERAAALKARGDKVRASLAHVEAGQHLVKPKPPHTFRAPRALYDPTMTSKFKKARKHVAPSHRP